MLLQGLDLAMGNMQDMHVCVHMGILMHGCMRAAADPVLACKELEGHSTVHAPASVHKSVHTNRPVQPQVAVCQWAKAKAVRQSRRVCV